MADSTLKIGAATVPTENRLGLKATDYHGGKSTLCAGCGHDAISNQIIRAFYEMSVKPESVAKFSGIGCSSKTPAYFLQRSHGFNAVHGRMPAIATGAILANHKLQAIGVSGDGDTASIGLGQFMHMVRRNIPMIYIIENNGVYGLTKGQFSATADEGSRLKTGVVNDLPPMDLCALAVELGCGFVARGFAGDPKQMVNILKAAIAHDGLSVIDVISPCVTFNNHDSSTKSYTYAKEHQELLHQIGFVPEYEQIEVDYEAGTVREVELHDGSKIVLKKLEEDYDPSDDVMALQRLHRAVRDGHMLTGIVHLRPEKKSFMQLLNVVDEPLTTLPLERTRPPQEALDAIMRDLM
ncbi:MAG: 2-oxoacid:ferredoxin oxidoreductase subunit beta [Acidobacteria bacterium]|nr:2-oxoacid:ferredoxin oxidoreductase subunit beta [Acidobacteriota bacterium]MBV9476553.1 2-oxoacid:ferredoxin oxidoreductase subunit beta [Acidobacteriota bacterium]